MCGILGFYTWDEGVQPALDMMLSWAMLARRGSDACGAAWLTREGTFGLFKSAGTANHVGAKLYTEHLSQPLTYAMFHARAMTQGPVSVPENNHPVQSGHIILAHNGIVRNDDEVFKELKVERQGTVDTAAMAAAIDRVGLEKALDMVHGSMAISWVDDRVPDVLNLYTNGSSPLWMSVEPGKLLVYGSTEEYVPVGLKGGASGEAVVGTHYVVSPTGVEQKVVGVGKTKWVAPSAYSSYAADWYLCYRDTCQDVGMHFHHYKSMQNQCHFHRPSYWPKDDSRVEALVPVETTPPPFFGGHNYE